MGRKDVSRKEFIRLGTVLGVGSAVIPMAACGGGGQTPGNDEAPRERGASGSGGNTAAQKTEGASAGRGEKPATGNAIAEASEVRPGEALKFEDAGQPAVLVHLENGDFVAYSAVCTHQQCTVAYQRQSGLLSCPCHGSTFDPAESAAVVNGPANRPLPEIPVEVRGGSVVKS